MLILTGKSARISCKCEYSHLSVYVCAKEDVTMTTHFTKTEQEVIVLKAIWEMISEMVNYEIFDKLQRTDEVQLMFKSVTCQRLFNVLLVDFLSQPKKWPFGLAMPPQSVSKSERNLLFHLKKISEDPKLNPAGGNALKSPLESFMQWLEADCLVEKVWLPSIGVESDITVQRVAFIKICGNIAKHNFARLSVNVQDICDILKANGISIDTDHGYLVIPEFYEWFHTNVFNYHSSAIAEFLNNIRWAIFEYLRPEFSRSFTKDDPASIAYRFKYPQECNNPVVQPVYWDLMNAVRSEPFMPKFEVTHYLKMRY